jgi:hypothetical protein
MQFLVVKGWNLHSQEKAPQISQESESVKTGIPKKPTPLLQDRSDRSTA